MDTETLSRRKLASAIHEWVEKSGVARVAASAVDGPYPVLYIETPDGIRHHLRIISVRGREHDRFEVG